MSVRIACVASLFFVRGWWILLVGLAVVILPYFAVLVANQAAHGATGNPETPQPLEVTGGTTPQHDSAGTEDVLLVVDAPMTSTTEGATDTNSEKSGSNVSADNQTQGPSS